MFNGLLPHIIFIAILIVILALLKIGKIRHAHIVSEGYAGLLYHKGKFTERLDAGQHLRHGRHFTVTMVDLRKSILNVPGQEVLTAGTTRIWVL
jgi:regulator of protease activity HflC (stomatin/prohibitin superfamily)